MLEHHRILVVEDNIELNDVLCEFFRDEGFAVTPAVDGRQAITRARQDDPDVIVLDVILPDIDGIALLARLAQAGIDAPVILESCLPVPAYARAHAFLAKPFDLDRLLGLVERLLDSPSADAARDA
jgi:DNA-binding response OmpR family regulator